MVPSVKFKLLKTSQCFTIGLQEIQIINFSAILKMPFRIGTLKMFPLRRFLLHFWTLSQIHTQVGSVLVFNTLWSLQKHPLYYMLQKNAPFFGRILDDFRLKQIIESSDAQIPC